jgi:hypothetical protein
MSEVVPLCTGIHDGMTVMMLASKAADLHALANESDARMPSIEQELARTARRMQRTTASTGPPGGEFTFGSYMVLPVAHMPEVKPGEEQALALLHRLAADPGIVSIMNDNRFEKNSVHAVAEPCLPTCLVRAQRI